jgi:hypothetical protein
VAAVFQHEATGKQYVRQAAVSSSGGGFLTDLIVAYEWLCFPPGVVCHCCIVASQGWPNPSMFTHSWPYETGLNSRLWVI